MLDSSSVIPSRISEFEDILISYKERHDENVSMVNAISPEMARAIAVWPNVPVSMYEIDKEGGPGSSDPWEWVRFSYSSWQTLAGVRGDHWLGVARSVIGNHMVFPDGTLPQYIRAFLVSRAREIMGV